MMRYTLNALGIALLIASVATRLSAIGLEPDAPLEAKSLSVWALIGFAVACFFLLGGLTLTPHDPQPPAGRRIQTRSRFDEDAW